MQRISSLSSQLTGNQPLISSMNVKSPDDVVIIGAYRTALQKARKGNFRETAPELLLKAVLIGLVEKTGVDKTLIEDMVVGNCLQPGAGALVARAAQLMAGLPIESSAAAVNRQCSSGIEACSIIASKIRAGIIDLGIGAGVENMSMYDFNGSVAADKISDDLFDHEVARNTLLPMGITSENVAKKYNIKREDLDKFACESQRRALQAQKNGWFDDEIIPVKAKITDKDGNEKEVLVSKDNGIRAGTTVEKLARLKPSFDKKAGVSTAGNSSQTTDGAAAVLLARRSVAEAQGLPIIGKFISYAVVGVPPDIMGVGPAYAIPACLKKAGLTTKDVDTYELNEAFASQAKWCVDKLGLDMAKVNPRGGAIALGHPLGCTGARMVATVLSELRRVKGRYGVISMCIGTGMGAAALIENEA